MLVPGAFNVWSARVVVDMGCDAVCVSGAGADILFVEAVTEPAQIHALPQRLTAPQLMNMVIGGKTPITDAQELARLGVGFVLYANAALQGALAGMSRVLQHVSARGRSARRAVCQTPAPGGQARLGRARAERYRAP